MQSRLLEGHSRGIRTLAWSPDSNYFVSASDDNTICIWDRNGKYIKQLKGHKSKIYILDWAPDSKLLASVELGTGMGDKVPAVIGLWNREGELIKWQKTSLIRALEWSPDGKFLATGSVDKLIRLWNKDGELVKVLEGAKGSIYSLAWSSYNGLLASSCADGEILFWDKEWNFTKVTHEVERGDIVKLIWSPNGKLLASFGGGNILLWNEKGEHVRDLTFSESVSYAHKEEIMDLVWSSDNNLLASASWDCTILLWEKNGKCFRILEVPDSRSEHRLLLMPRSISWSPIDNIIASTYIDGTIRFWDTDGDCIGLTKINLIRKDRGRAVTKTSYRTQDTEDYDDTVLWSPDGKILAVWEMNYTSILLFKWIDATFDQLTSEIKKIPQSDVKELIEKKICPICIQPILPEDNIFRCKYCATLFHKECKKNICSICQDPFLPNQEVYKCYNCTTGYHSHCLRKWIIEEGYKVCPQCGNLFIILRE